MFYFSIEGIYLDIAFDMTSFMRSDMTSDMYFDMTSNIFLDMSFCMISDITSDEFMNMLLKSKIMKGNQGPNFKLGCQHKSNEAKTHT